MIEYIRLILICAPPLVFLTALILYGALFRWEDSFQGRSMIGLLLALVIILGMNAVVALSYTIYGSIAEWWSIASMGAFAALTVAGIGLCVSLFKSRVRSGDSGEETVDGE